MSIAYNIFKNKLGIKSSKDRISLILFILEDFFISFSYLDSFDENQ